MNKVIFILTFLVASSAYAAEKVEFSEKELAQESVYPLFDDPVPVKKRNIVTKGKFEFTGFLGWTLNEAFFEPMNFGGMATFHFNETHGAQLYFTKFNSSTNDKAAQLTNKYPTFNFNRVPLPQSLAFAAYQITPYYGKISLSKQNVMNLSLYGTAGVGSISYDSGSYMALGLGFGAKFYITKRLSFRPDFRYITFKGPHIVEYALGRTGMESQSSNIIMTMGVGYLF